MAVSSHDESPPRSYYADIRTIGATFRKARRGKPKSQYPSTLGHKEDFMELASLLKIVLLIPTEDSKGTSKTVPSNKEGNQRISRRLSRENSPPKFKWFKFSGGYHRLEFGITGGTGHGIQYGTTVLNRPSYTSCRRTRGSSWKRT